MHFFERSPPRPGDGGDKEPGNEDCVNTRNGECGVQGQHVGNVEELEEKEVFLLITAGNGYWTWIKTGFVGVNWGLLLIDRSEERTESWKRMGIDVEDV